MTSHRRKYVHIYVLMLSAELTTYLFHCALALKANGSRFFIYSCNKVPSLEQNITKLLVLHYYFDVI